MVSVNVAWDADAKLWVATSPEVPEFRLTHPRIDELYRILPERMPIPENADFVLVKGRQQPAADKKEPDRR